jgi:KDO2-lipid IV(A) lauroyltransferase
MGSKHGAWEMPRWVVRLQVALLWGATQVLRALPARWVLAFADTATYALYAINRRARKVAAQNLRAVFGDDLAPEETRRLVMASFRESVRSALLLAYLHPLTTEKLSRWLYISDDAHTETSLARVQGGGIMVSGHVGNWELLLTAPLLTPLPDVVFVAEEIPNPAANEVIERLRRYGGIDAALRKGGMIKIMRSLKEGKLIGILADRNVRGRHGGIYVPFLGLPARTTRAPAWLALRTGKPLVVVFCFPEGDRYRFWVGPDLSEDLPEGTLDERVEHLTERVNHVIGAVVRAAPETWNWALKRFKSRPTEELGPYPPYSRYEP